MFLTAHDFVESVGIDDRLDVSKEWERVFTQAIRHTRGDGVYELLETQRPHESSYVRDYRLNNIRLITKEGAVKFNDKAARIIQSSHYTITNKSPELTEWLDTTSYQLGNGDTVGFNEYFVRFVLPCSFEDPNALIVAFPFNPDNPEVAPAAPVELGGLQPNKKVSVKPMVIPSKDIWHVGDNIYSWVAGSVPLQTKNKTTIWKDWFFVVDDMNFYQYVPTGFVMVEGVERVRYELFVWFFHDTGQGDKHELPLNILGGTLTKDSGCDCTFYESYMSPFFEFGDEVLNVFSDWQAVRVRTSFPVRAFVEQPCKPCKGQGKVQHYDKDDKTHKWRSCDSCGGKGYMASLGPFSDIVIDAKGGFDNKDTNQAPLSYIAPPLDSQQELDKNWRQLLIDAKKSINLDLLENLAESGTAKEQRLKDLKDMLIKIGGNLFDVMEKFLWYTECLLQPNRSQRQVPVIIKPISYEIKSEEMLRNEAKDAHGADAVTSLMQFYRHKYAGNEELIKIKELALEYAPLLAIQSPQELQLRIASGAYDESDIIKRDRAEQALQRIARDVDIFDLTEDAIFAMLDEMLVPFLPTRSVVVEPNGE